MAWFLCLFFTQRGAVPKEKLKMAKYSTVMTQLRKLLLFGDFNITYNMAGSLCKHFLVFFGVVELCFYH